MIMRTRRSAFSLWFVGGSLSWLRTVMVYLVPLIPAALTLITARMTGHRSLAAGA